MSSIIIINEPPSSSKTWNALRIAAALLGNDEQLEVFFMNDGVFNILENQKPPKEIDNGMKLASIHLPPYTFKPTDVRIKRFKTQRFTMRDIGRIKNRLETLESQTALSLLERDSE